MTNERQFLLQHSAHDYDDLVRRWEQVAQSASLQMECFHQSGDLPHFFLRGEADSEGVYLSAGIHGDEAAATLGLIQWAETSVEWIATQSILIFPCLNPWGLINNRRHNADDEDLNRCFGQTNHPLIKDWAAVIGKNRFQTAACLHEDYDARGCYLYELSPPGSSLGERCLEATEAIIPREPDAHIEGRPANNALIYHDGDLEELTAELEKEEGGLPEAIQLAINHAERSLTFETPSEYSLYLRVQAQMTFLDTMTRP
tara:strand:+ start:7648 stop:8421 length:774 start_codon:yes stop_codon:yes gene_type:complete